MPSMDDSLLPLCTPNKRCSCWEAVLLSLTELAEPVERPCHRCNTQTVHVVDKAAPQQRGAKDSTQGPPVATMRLGGWSS